MGSGKYFLLGLGIASAFFLTLVAGASALPGGVARFETEDVICYTIWNSSISCIPKPAPAVKFDRHPVKGP